MSSLSQEICNGSSISTLDPDRKQYNTGQREEAQTRSREMMVIHLHRGEENLPSHFHEE
jgi:hypothetical protein